MQNEPPDNEIYPDESRRLERPAIMDDSQLVDGPIPIAREVQAAEVGSPVSSQVTWAPEPEPSEPVLVVVDPYTGATPPPPRQEFAPLFGELAPDEGNEWEERVTTDDPFIPLPYSPSSQGETVRRSGLAWSAGIAFFGSVAFTLFLGWIADLLLGTFPWGIVGGIVLGSIIGFLQFFRITARIFPSRDNGPEITPLMSRKDDD